MRTPAQIQHPVGRWRARHAFALDAAGRARRQAARCRAARDFGGEHYYRLEARYRVDLARRVREGGAALAIRETPGAVLFAAVRS